MNNNENITSLDLELSFNFGINPCLSIKNSYLIDGRGAIKATLNFIHTLPEYKKLQEAGYTRTLKSEYQEWKAHNFLYRMGIKRERTKRVDIDQNESKLRLFGYAILSLF